MNINELFEKIQDKFLPEELNGEFQLHGNCIVWTYNLENNCDEMFEPYNCDEDEELQFNFESLSSEEILQEAYDCDMLKIDGLLDELEESDDWSFSEPDINEDTISFKIF